MTTSVAQAAARATRDSAAVSAEDLRFSYGDIEAVKGISFEIAPGEIFGFLGPNGAGKTTTIKMLTGQLQPASGVVRILGRDAGRDDPQVQARIGVCFEEKNLYDAMSGEENLRFFASLYGVEGVDTAALLERVGLAERARDRVGSYSKGMRQRLMVARSILHQPMVLFLDEPTDGLDPVSSKAIRGLIREEAERGAAVLLTTHDMWEADELSHRVAFINEGQIYAIDTPENLKLQHGRRSVTVRRRDGAGVSEERFARADGAVGEQGRGAVASEGRVSIRAEESTLENIFVEMTGRTLEA